MALFLVRVVVVAVIGFGPMAPADGHAGALLLSNVEAVDESGALLLEKGEKLCLAGLWVPSGATDDAGANWRSAWQEMIAENIYHLRDEQIALQDRYGCALAKIETAGGLSLQQALIGAGWALVEPASARMDGEALEALFTLEAEARDARRGLWRDPAIRVRRADDLSDWIGTRQIVAGRVRRVSDNDRYIYLNFGADWRTDFTVRLRHKLFDENDQNHKIFAGKKMRVRGVVQDSRGPLIDVFNLQQIELLP